MGNRLLHQSILFTFLVSAICLPRTAAWGQSFKTLYSFPALSSSGTNNSGANPRSTLLLSDNFLFGMTFGGGTSGKGVVYRMNMDGSGFTNLHSFDGVYDGNPWDGLALLNTTLYGTTRGASPSSLIGSVFQINTNGTGFSSLYTFTNNTGNGPAGGLLRSGESLFGSLSRTTTAFRIDANGSGFTALKSGGNAYGALELSGNTLFGTIGEGGAGAVFSIKTNGADYSTLHSFSGSDGANPYAGIVLANGVLYGTTLNGGNAGKGTVFKINTNGTSFATLHHFNGGHEAFPWGRLILLGDRLYGTTSGFPDPGFGAIFSLKVDGSDYTVLHQFSVTEGYSPLTGLTASGNALYGTASRGGQFGAGAVFSLTVQPQLTITRAGDEIAVWWPTNFQGFSLQHSSNLSPATDWEPTLPQPTIVDQWFITTNTISPESRFYRLSQ